MLKALLAGAAVCLTVAASPVFAQSITYPPRSAEPTLIGPPMGQPGVEQRGATEAFPSVPESPAERTQAHRDWNDMSREWQQREHNGTARSGGATSDVPAGAYGSGDTRIMPSERSSMPMRGSGLEGRPQEPATPAERAQVRRDWNDMAREWEQRQRHGGFAPSGDPGQPPLPDQR
jgi:hypothetical protein